MALGIKMANNFHKNHEWTPSRKQTSVRTPACTAAKSPLEGGVSSRFQQVALDWSGRVKEAGIVKTIDVYTANDVTLMTQQTTGMPVCTLFNSQHI